MHLICIDRIYTRNVKVPNRIKCALSQLTSVCGLNAGRSDSECECWWAQPSSHDKIVHVHSCARLVSGTQVIAAGWDLWKIKINSME